MEQVSPGSPSCWRFLTEGRQLAIYSLLPFWQTSPSKKAMPQSISLVLVCLLVATTMVVVGAAGAPGGC